MLLVLLLLPLPLLLPCITNTTAAEDSEETESGSESDEYEEYDGASEEYEIEEQQQHKQPKAKRARVHVSDSEPGEAEEEVVPKRVKPTQTSAGELHVQAIQKEASQHPVLPTPVPEAEGPQRKHRLVSCTSRRSRKRQANIPSRQLQFPNLKDPQRECALAAISRTGWSSAATIRD